MTQPTGKPKFPSIPTVAKALREANTHVLDGEMDVRLQVFEDGQWALRTGDSQYDQDHRGYWGSGILDGKRFNSENLARDLLNQAKEQHATGNEPVPSESAGLGRMQGHGAA